MDRRLAILKALSDNTRYAIYVELASTTTARSTQEICDELGLHPNTVRPHLERMREVGLLEVTTDSRGTVGRPQHRYRVAADAPSLGIEPPSWQVLARMLADVAAFMAPEQVDVVAMGTEQGRAAAERRRGAPCVAALNDALAELGFEPAVGDDGTTTAIAFTNCPFRDLAEAYPELVCNLHRGFIEGFVEEMGESVVTDFRTLADRDPCHVELATPSR
ncbi:MAG TPA: helix-turn-helix domain-containing protein [Acidimicrobiales bacterium]|nr:helix-turn-helix domain-containing protein [Acidimicrobiales bacterium]